MFHGAIPKTNVAPFYGPLCS